MLSPSPMAFHVSKIKSLNAKAPTIVMMAFFRLPEIVMHMESQKEYLEGSLYEARHQEYPSYLPRSS
jgi:hypothetical protein